MENNASQEEQTQERVKCICVAPQCTNNNLTTKKLDIQFHRFPVKRKDVLQRWLAALRTVPPPSSSLAAVCSRHFQKEDYLEEEYFEGDVVKLRRTLKPDAVPSIFPSPFSKADTSEQEAGKPSQQQDVGLMADVALPEADKSQSSRIDKALGLLTQKFMEMLNSSSDGILDINQVVSELKISRRRIYDITNVLEGISLIKKKSKNIVEWVGGHPDLTSMNDELKTLIVQEKALDAVIIYAKQQIEEMYENLLSRRFAYLTYEDIQSIPIFKDQAVFVIRAPPETKLEVAHPAEAFRIHINSSNGPVEVLVCSDTLDISQSKNHKSTKFDDGDYSYVPLPGFSAASPKDNSNHNTKSGTISDSPSEPKQQILQVVPSPPKSTSAPSPSEDQLNSASLIPPLTVSVKEEWTNLNPVSNESMNDDFAPVEEHDQVPSDVDMTDVS